jgi:hypothetical protein
MQEEGGVDSPVLGAPHRWPSVLAVVALAGAMTLTGALFFRDRQNSALASSSLANAAQDEVAYVTLSRLSTSIELANAFQRTGVLGMRQLAVHSLRSLVVAPLGGTLSVAPAGWTLALGGGWACLTWAHVQAHWTVPVVSRGVCGQAQIQVTQTVPRGAYAIALTNDVRSQRAAIDAGYVTAAFASTAQGYSPRFSLAALADRFHRLGPVGFRSVVTPHGVTVIDGLSTACVMPTASAQLARISAGACAS